ncbi:MAG TPA: S8 family serine peptidase [Methylomirabilota bacterium]|nr:S8 family serine peptidase [Methylomirabilota bacterium]
MVPPTARAFALAFGVALGPGFQGAPAELLFTQPQPALYRLDDEELTPATVAGPAWGRAWPHGNSGDYVEFGSRVVLGVEAGVAVHALIHGRPLTPVRWIHDRLLILQAPDARAAAREAADLARRRGVVVSYPVIRNTARLESAYAAAPNDPHFPPQLANVTGQWYLENRDVTNGAVLGPDLNVRAAWPHTRGEGVTLAVADVGFELTHRELTNRVVGAPHWNFVTGTSNAAATGTSRTWAHATEVAGLAAATGGNGFGMSGVAPAARLASWVIFTNASRLASDEVLMEMYSFASNIVSVQNHSWNRGGLRQTGPTPLERAGMAAAIAHGRGGKGVVMVRAGGNDRASGANANDDYPADPDVIAVASVARNGRVAGHSEPGACLLVAAPSADAGDNALFTTDLSGPAGANFVNFLPPFEYLSDFAFNSLGFSGTSASTPLAAGTAALVLAANPHLTHRDVQQVLLQSARHFDFADPDVKTNGAGLVVSHSLGFGVVDAGHAVRLARAWSNRPALVTITQTFAGPLAIPDGGLKILVTGPDVPGHLQQIPCVGGTGPFPDDPTAPLPLAYLGPATTVPAEDLTGLAALIERSTNVSFATKIFNAAVAGAAFAIIHNVETNPISGSCPGGDQLCPMGGTDFVPIPAVFIGHRAGIELRDLFATNRAARAQLSLAPATIAFGVADPLSLEHVGVRLQTDHPRRAEIRVTLVSPAGTRSVLQRLNSDTNAGPVDWTYWSTHHFYEPAAGQWRLEVSDQLATRTGSALSASLILRGVAIADSDEDGLDDNWEQAHFDSLARGLTDDPDGDGYNNAREHAMGTDPTRPNDPFRVDLARWDARLLRLNWPGVEGQTYEVWGGPQPTDLTRLATVPGRFPETEWLTSSTNLPAQFFQIRTPAP